MKVYAVNPGSVRVSALDGKCGACFMGIPCGYHARHPWRYTIVYQTDNGRREELSSEGYARAPAAKQAMREQVAVLRRRHGV